jgi:hypothetical protein
MGGLQWWLVLGRSFRERVKYDCSTKIARTIVFARFFQVLSSNWAERAKKMVRIGFKDHSRLRVMMRHAIRKNPV